jgi:flavorubredoxin
LRATQIRSGVTWIGAMDWNRRLFDALVPLPDGTSYNAYLLEGSEKTALVDTVDPSMAGVLASRLDGVGRIDYVVSHHVEQDHSGAIPMVLGKYPDAMVLSSPKAEGMLVDHLRIPAERIQAVEDGQSVSLGDKTLRFFLTPWVHWPETMVTYLAEERILFTCDFFGSHLATSELYASGNPSIWEAAKHYFAEIMMPFRKFIRKNLQKVGDLKLDLIAPSHGPIHDEPQRILDAYGDWVSDRLSNLVVIAYVSMHGSTEAMVEHLVGALAERGITVVKLDLSVTDVRTLAYWLIDAATLVIGTPSVLGGPHPSVAMAALLASALRPKLKHAAVIGSYGWGSRLDKQVAEMLAGLKLELFDPVLAKGYPREDDLAALDRLADAIQQKHEALPAVSAA